MSKLNGDCYLRRNGLARAFESKVTGWTLLTAEGRYLDLLAPAAVMIWEGISEEGIGLRELLEILLERFPQMEPERIFSDVIALVEELVALGFVQVGSPHAGAAPPEAWEPRPPDPLPPPDAE
jgi:hypothetical protein